MYKTVGFERHVAGGRLVEETKEAARKAQMKSFSDIDVELSFGSHSVIVISGRGHGPEMEAPRQFYPYLSLFPGDSHASLSLSLNELSLHDYARLSLESHGAAALVLVARRPLYW